MFVLLQVNHNLLWRTDEGRPVSLEEGQAFVLPEPGWNSLGPTIPSAAAAKLLTATTMKGPFRNLPAEMVASKGRLIFDLIELFSGKTVPGRVGSYSFPCDHRFKGWCSANAILI